MKKFTKNEIWGLGVIFLVLLIISIPNFLLSLRRARDQVRRDDLGALVKSLDEYLTDFGKLPPASTDGRIMDCIYPGEKVTVDKKGRLIVNLRPCDWGGDAFADLTPGSKKVYMPILPRDPDFQKGVTYLYFTDGDKYQIFAWMEGGRDEAEYDPTIVARNLMCGTKICNVGRAYNTPIDISIEEYDRRLLNK